MPKFLKVRFLLMFLMVVIFSGCSSNQSVKNAWKSTKTSWYTYASPKASIDYDDSGSISEGQNLLSTEMIDIDMQLIKLERIMLNGDKSPTGKWVSDLFKSVPWITGFAGVRANGEILGQEPAGSSADLDFAPLLETDEKQSMRALRASVQTSSSTDPEIMLATPLYESSDFLGIVVTYFNMSSLLRYSTTPEKLIIFTPNVLLWSGSFGHEPDTLMSLDWNDIVKNNASGNLETNNREFHWVVRYLGNLPIIFAVPQAI